MYSALDLRSFARASRGLQTLQSAGVGETEETDSEQQQIEYSLFREHNYLHGNIYSIIAHIYIMGILCSI